MNSELTNTLPKPTYRRHIFYVDGAIQRPLLVAMVVLEIALLATATWIAYQHLNVMIDESLYRVHITDTGPIWKRLAKEGAWMLGVFAAINLLALMIAEWIWSRRENLITQSFSQFTLKTSRLDFSMDMPIERPHRIQTLTLSWRARERERFLAICREAEQVRDLAASDAQTNEILDSLKSLKRHLS
jgi:hypothetical protein